MTQSITPSRVQLKYVALIGIGITSALLWWLIFERPLSLAQYGDLNWQSLGTITQLSTPQGILMSVGFAALFGLYWLGSRFLKAGSRMQLAIVMGFALLFNVILVFMYPVDAADVYDNIIRGRMSAVYGLNPFAQTPQAVPDDPFYRYAIWRDVPTAYGPAWETLTNLTTRLIGDDYTLNVIAYKLLTVIGLLITALLIWLTLRIVAPERAVMGAYLFAWNPLLVYSSGQGGHNDTLMAACIALSVLCLARRRYTLATYAATLGFLVKFIPALLIPVILIATWRNLRSAARLRSIAASLIGCVVIAALGYAPYWSGPNTLRLDRLGGMFTGSLAVVIRSILSLQIDQAAATTLVKTVTLGIFGLFTLIQLILYWRTPRDDRDPNDELWRAIRVSARILAVYLVVATTWFQAWYVAWLIALVAFLSDSPLRRWALAFSYLVTLEGIIYNFVSFRYDGPLPSPWVDAVPVAVYMGGALLFGLYLLVQAYFTINIQRRSTQLITT